MFTAPATPLMEFQSTPPRRGRPAWFATFPGRFYFNPRPREGGDAGAMWRSADNGYFNPRPREGGDAALRHSNTPPYYISIHAPREGGDQHLHGALTQRIAISIHAPREGGDAWCFCRCWWLSISIHAPREGGDIAPPPFNISPDQFQSTPPARGATPIVLAPVALPDISIHAPREGGDSV